MSKRAKTEQSPTARVERAATILYSIAAIIAALGIAETTYLTAMHLSGASVVCVASSGCSQVLQSAYASVRGIPLALIGGLGYFTAFSCAILAAFGYRRAQGLLGIIVGLMFGTTLWLLYVQARVLHNFCDYCLLSAALIFLLAGVVVATPRRS